MDKSGNLDLCFCGSEPEAEHQVHGSEYACFSCLCIYIHLNGRHCAYPLRVPRFCVDRFAHVPGISSFISSSYTWIYIALPMLQVPQRPSITGRRLTHGIAHTCVQEGHRLVTGIVTPGVSEQHGQPLLVQTISVQLFLAMCAFQLLQCRPQSEHMSTVAWAEDWGQLGIAFSARTFIQQ